MHNHASAGCSSTTSSSKSPAALPAESSSVSSSSSSSSDDEEHVVFVLKFLVQTLQLTQDEGGQEGAIAQTTKASGKLKQFNCALICLDLPRTPSPLSHLQAAASQSKRPESEIKEPAGYPFLHILTNLCTHLCIFYVGRRSTATWYCNISGSKRSLMVSRPMKWELGRRFGRADFQVQPILSSPMAAFLKIISFLYENACTPMQMLLFE